MRGLSALCVTLTLAIVGCGGSSTLTEDALRKQAETIHSTAAEGALLAAGAARDRSTEPFIRVHSGALAEQAKSARKALASATAPRALDPDRRRAAATAARVQQALDRLHTAPTDRDLAREVERELERDARTAGQLAG